jgi:HEAT repeat protein
MLRVKDGVVGLLNALKHQQAAVRLHAVKALMQQELEPELALRRFTAALGDDTPAVRQAALQALEKLGGDAVPILIKALVGPDLLLRREAAHTLGRLGPLAASAVPELIAALQVADRRLVQESAKALGEIGPEAGPAIPALIELMGDTHFLACRLASWALVRIGPSSVLALTGALEHADAYVRAEAVWALAHLGPAARPAVPALLKHLRSEAASVMCKVARVSVEDNEVAQPTAPVFIAVRRNREENFWIWLIRAFENIGPGADEAIPDLLRLHRHGTGTFQLLARQALRKIDPVAAHP